MNNNIMKLIALSVLIAILNGCAFVPVKKPIQNEKASDINVQLGIGYMQQNNLEVANQKLNRALIQNPDSAVAHNAFAILQERLLQFDVAEKHYKKGTELDATNSQVHNNYGVFLCNRGRQAESESYFLTALKQPLYRTPEFAYTNAGVCMLQIGEMKKAETYFKKALAARSNFPSALVNLADLYYLQDKYTESLIYLKRYNLIKNNTAKSLWLEARNHLGLGNMAIATQKIDLLKSSYPDSKEFKEWESINQ